MDIPAILRSSKSAVHLRFWTQSRLTAISGAFINAPSSGVRPLGPRLTLILSPISDVPGGGYTGGNLLSGALAALSEALLSQAL